MDPKKVTIVILTWNGLNYTKRCLETLRALTDFQNYEVVVVDNGSTDGSVEYLRSIVWIRLILNSSNRGFAKANNQAIEMCDDVSDVVLLNNDTEILQRNWLTKLQETAYQTPAIGIVGARLRRPDGMLQHAGTYMPIDTFWGQQLGSLEKDINQYNQDTEVEGVVFACVYIKRNVLQKVGPLDEDYFSYFEDTDYCLRAKRHGFKVMCCGGVTLLHHENISTRVNNVSHGDLFAASQITFKKKWQREFDAECYTKEVNWHSVLTLPTGYATSSKEIVLELDQQGVRVNYKYLYGKGTIFPLAEPEQSSSYMLNLIRQRKVTSSGTHICYGQADAFKPELKSFKIGFTMLEVDGLPADWVRLANRMDEIWTPSYFNLETFSNSGVKRPIQVMPLGVNPGYFNSAIQGFRLRGPFTYLSMFEWGERKAPEILLKAFNDEFSANEDVVLICKTYNSDVTTSITDQVKSYGLSEAGGRVIFSINEVLPGYQIGSIYRSVDCFVLPTRGEGWGLPIMEAMACGLPVIATNWSGPVDFMTKDTAYPLDVERLEPAEAKCPYYKGFNWAKPSYEHLRYLMRHVYENRDEARMVGQKASQEILSKWTWAHTVQKMLDRLDEVR
jgi:GT2 family glycosyltransferase/glycosyltransferase involved in cell wall biosynthesis